MIKQIPTRRYPRATTVGILFVFACLAALLAGCDTKEYGSRIFLTDSKGCQYIGALAYGGILGHDSSLLPITDSTGKQVCK